MKRHYFAIIQYRKWLNEALWNEGKSLVAKEAELLKVLLYKKVKAVKRYFEHCQIDNSFCSDKPFQTAQFYNPRDNNQHNFLHQNQHKKSTATWS